MCLLFIMGQWIHGKRKANRNLDSIGRVWPTAAAAGGNDNKLRPVTNAQRIATRRNHSGSHLANKEVVTASCSPTILPSTPGFSFDRFICVRRPCPANRSRLALNPQTLKLFWRMDLLHPHRPCPSSLNRFWAENRNLFRGRRWRTRPLCRRLPWLWRTMRRPAGLSSGAERGIGKNLDGWLCFKPVLNRWMDRRLHPPPMDQIPSKFPPVRKKRPVRG